MLEKTFRVFVKAVSALPLPRALALGRGLGWVYGSVIRYHRADAIDALTRAFPEKNRSEVLKIVRSMYANLGMNVVELCRLIDVDPEYVEKFTPLEGRENLDAALERGKGAIMLTGHIGNWDLLCTLTPRFGYPLTVITKRMKNRALHDIWIRIRESYGVKFVPAHHSYRQCLSALRKGELVGFILDQNMIVTEGVFVDFFGRKACTTPGLAYMSAQSRAPVVPVVAVREADGHHRVRLLPALEPPPDRSPEAIRKATQTYTRILEDLIREHPDQWIWLHRRWRTQPQPGSDAGAPAS